MTAQKAKHNVQLGQIRRIQYQPDVFTSHPLLAMMEIGELKAEARKVGKRMAELRRLEMKARRQHTSYYAYSQDFHGQRNWLREIQRAYRRRLENLKARGL